MNQNNLLITYEFHILTALFILVYFVAMCIQIIDKEIDLKWYDWPLTLVSNAIIGVIVMFATLTLTNPGWRIGLILGLSLFGYPIIKTAVSKQSQKEVGTSVFAQIKNLIARIFNLKNPDQK